MEDAHLRPKWLSSSQGPNGAREMLFKDGSEETAQMSGAASQADVENGGASLERLRHQHTGARASREHWYASQDMDVPFGVLSSPGGALRVRTELDRPLTGRSGKEESRGTPTRVRTFHYRSQHLVHDHEPHRHAFLQSHPLNRRRF